MKLGWSTVYVNTFEDVGIEEHQRQVEKSNNSQQLQKAAKLIIRLCVAMGLEPTGAAAQQCSTPGVIYRDHVAYGTIFMVILLALGMYGWKKLKEAMRDVDSIQVQIATTMQHGCVNVWII